MAPLVAGVSGGRDSQAQCKGRVSPHRGGSPAAGRPGSGAALCGWARVRDQPGSIQQVVGAQKCVWGTTLGEGHIEGVLHTDVK